MSKGALFDGVYHRTLTWFWVHVGDFRSRCGPCIQGHRAFTAGGKLLTRIYHKQGFFLVRCKSPWFWRGHVAAGKMPRKEL